MLIAKNEDVLPLTLPHPLPTQKQGISRTNCVICRTHIINSALKRLFIELFIAIKLIFILKISLNIFGTASALFSVLPTLT